MVGWCLVLGHGCGWPSLPSCWADRSLRSHGEEKYADFQILIRNADALRINRPLNAEGASRRSRFQWPVGYPGARQTWRFWAVHNDCGMVARDHGRGNAQYEDSVRWISRR